MFKLYAIKFTLTGDGQIRKECVTSHKATTKAALKRKMTHKLTKFYPESVVNGGKEYFNIIAEVFQGDSEEWNVNHI